MAESFIGEIKLFSFARPPRDWVPCDGRLLPIAQNQALFALLGVQFGGDGTTTFAVPDLRGRAPVHPGNAPQGTTGGVENVALTPAQMPAHNHGVAASKTNGSVNEFGDAVLAAASSEGAKLFAPPGGDTQALSSGVVASSGAGEAHENCQPSLVANYCIAIAGIFPSPG